MPLFFIYLTKLSIAITLVYLFYQLVLRRLTFYNWNRLYLLIYTLIAFFIPLVNISPAIDNDQVLPLPVIEFVPVIENFTSEPGTGASVETVSGIGTWSIMMLILLVGLLFFLIKLLVQFLSLISLKRKSNMISEGGIKIYQVEKNIIPFSFGDSIFINKQLHEEKELREIIRHEFIHVKQKHTIDIIWSELFTALNWYNPFAWMIRKSIRQNLEFIADANVLEGGIDPKEYQYLLLKVMGSAKFRITSQFNFSSLKNRIAMMNRIKSAKIHLMKFLFILPLMSFLLLAFRDKINYNNDIIVRYVGMVIDKDSRLPIEGVSITDQESAKKTISDKNGYYAFDFLADNKMNVNLKFEKPGYASYTNNSFSLLVENNVTSFALIAIDALKKGDPKMDCIGCSTSETVSDLKSNGPGYNEVKQYYSNYLESLRSGKYVPLKDGVKGFEIKTTSISSQEIKDLTFTGTVTINDKHDDVNNSGNEETLNNSSPVFKFYGENIKVISGDTLPERTDDYKAFLKRNTFVKRVFWMSNPFRIGIELKDGTREMYTLENNDEVTSAKNKYGKLPEPPPTPPIRENKDDISNVEVKGAMPDVVMKIEASVLNLYPGNRLKFSGNVNIESKGDKISSDEIDMKISDISLLIMDDVEITSPAIIVNEGLGKYELTIFKKEHAMEKYGSKGINGALVLKTL